MRGKGDEAKKYAKQLRITPAYAGKSNIFRQDEFGIIGSPPPMRGKVLVHFV